ncbi:hypothetical protein WAI453_007189 [Rhynchosporium graminicola]|uniref:Probable FSH2 Serine hydrolase that localizes to both the nucleus and cytoplasm n=1 Tax=Rhynchosporium graminicola TaxID=2792576 RepID=A0A1E1LDA7_9HELO|nr:probable FSH2 Serine hydrolase that localizes to both the nucleus and cytoplasm [Rhynchosporium commune]
MKFLCLCGAYGSSDKFRVQLAPLVNELASDKTAELFFIHGPVQAYPPQGFEEYFGQAPYYRFIEPNKGDGTAEGGDDVLERIRHFPEGATAEDQMRELMNYGSGSGSMDTTPESSDDGSNFGDYSYSNSSAQNAMDYLYQIMEKEGPFDGIVGYSEGATVAATLLLHEQKRFAREGRMPMFKCALFFAGWPPMTPEFDGIVLADETDLTITIPTCHIIGSLDPYLAGSLALYNICDMDTAILFDHAKGHTLPRHKDTVRELGNVIRQMILDI